ncbi:MAG: thiamine phosphate synthase [Candidatus Omnitrophota bacterium]
MKGFYFATDDTLSFKGSLSDVQAAVKAKVEVIQYRCKNGSVKFICQQARELKQAAQGALFIINDRIDVALAVDADGVHLGQEDMPCDLARKILGPDKIIGISTHNIEQARIAQEQGASYIGIGAVFVTNTKAGVMPLGIKMVEQVVRQVSIPVVAIGGLNLENARQVIDAGVDAVCAISAVVTKQDVAQEILKFQRMFK